MNQTLAPFGMRFMEPLANPELAQSGSYDEKRHLYVNAMGEPLLAYLATTTGSNASTGGANETDYNEDYD